METRNKLLLFGIGIGVLFVISITLYFILHKGGCSNNSDCDNNQTCVSGTCKDKPHKGGYHVGSVCTKNSDCGDDQTCLNSTCKYKNYKGGNHDGSVCTNNSDCDNNQVCISICKDTIHTDGDCTKNSDCGDNQTCVSGTCKDKPHKGGYHVEGDCTKNSDCKDYQTCVNGICKNPERKDPDNGPLRHGRGHYCVHNTDTDLLECNRFEERPSNAIYGPWDSSAGCNDQCTNDCKHSPCILPNKVCISNKCIPCSENKLTLQNASNNSEWYVSYRNDGRYIPTPLIYSTGNDENDTFFTWFLNANKGPQRWDIITNSDGTFDISVMGGHGQSRI